ncbi:hypothetical protein [Rhodopseudomonas pseudopalustris]|uniref:Uncharacterized protein n=1 Tax=Rhodopseudomonas pseudopalustris TaxID=1513892 RepID=A0A1H8VXB0_9BRAD|nr:hypothetical protein [Rhodopseudomonas pseudopalustris]SEP20041.1 hypothetical protein SAMN05444123_11018 [Rhodopseudomonas pseudopalustris]
MPPRKGTPQRPKVRQPPVADHFATIVALCEAGSTLAAACGAVPHGPNLNAVRRWVRNNADAAEQLRAARMAAGGTTRAPSRIPPEAWEAGLQAVATYEGALTSLRVPGQPHIDDLRRRADRDPGFAARLKAAFERRQALGLRKARFSPADYSAAIEKLKADRSRNMTEIDADLRRENLPALGTIYVRRYRDADLAKQYAESITATRGIFHFSEEAYDEALAILRSDPAKARLIIKRAKGRLPSFNAIVSRAKTDPAVAAIFGDARLKRRAAKAHARTDKANKPVYQDGVLRSGLLLDDLYREASTLFHRGLPDRDDMISEVVLAVLQGELKREEISTKGVKLGWARVSRFNKGTDSLDRPIARDGGSSTTVLDMVKADHWSFEDAI